MWNSINTLGNIAFWSLIVTAALTVVSIVATRRKESLQGKETASLIKRLTDAETRVADAIQAAGLATEGAGIANRRAGEAILDAGRAHVRAAKLEKEAAGAKLKQEQLKQNNLQLQFQVEQEKIERLRLEGRLADRTLSQGQISEIASVLREFQGMASYIFVYENKKEALQLGGMLRTALRSADWEVYMKPAENLQTHPGITIYVSANPSNNKQESAAAQELLAKLRLFGIVVTMSIHTLESFQEGEIDEIKERKSPKIVIAIGPKDIN